MFTLRYNTPAQWANIVLEDFDTFLADHASAENKASGMAMSMALHYKDKPELVTAMIDLAIEELVHFREVVRLMHQRNIHLQADEKDPYVNGLRKFLRKGTDAYFLDRLLLGSIIEARGAERFGLVAAALPDGSLKDFYTLITKSEDKHYLLFINLAHKYYPQPEVEQRLHGLLNIEAELVRSLPHRARLH